MQAISHLCLAGMLFFTLLGCDESSQDQLSELVKQARSTIREQAQDSLPAHEEISRMSTQELNKLLGWEYKIVDFQTPPSGGELEAKLNALGEERWECLVSVGMSVAVRVQCKRPAKAFLRKALDTLF